MFYNVEHECDVGDSINQYHSLGDMIENDGFFNLLLFCKFTIRLLKWFNIGIWSGQLIGTQQYGRKVSVMFSKQKLKNGWNLSMLFTRAGREMHPKSTERN